MGLGEGDGLGESADALCHVSSAAAADDDAHRQTGTQTHKSGNSISASFTTFTWCVCLYLSMSLCFFVCVYVCFKYISSVRFDATLLDNCLFFPHSFRSVTRKVNFGNFEVCNRHR